ncbi:hypothetical protein ACFL9U_06460 [Thermodesulfobacteriota bacterium]
METGRNMLFEPINIGSLKIKNRIAMAPMGTLHGTYDGYVTDQLIAHYGARAKGGVGLIVVEHSIATNKYGMGLLGLWDDWHITSMNELVEAVHYFGSKIVVQLSPGLGRMGASRWLGEIPVAPSAIPYFAAEESLPEIMRVKGGIKGELPRELSVEEIIELENLYAEAARRARFAKFDGIEIHAAHGYLIFGFLSPHSNHREDIYGGTRENRVRFLSNIIKKTRSKVGKNFVVGARISADEHVEGGLSISEMSEIVPLIVDEGLDYIHISSGTGESYNWLVPAETDKLLPEARIIKGVSSAPVICPNIHDPEKAREEIEKGNIDMVSIGRPLLADPEWPNKVMRGETEKIRKCQRDNYCFKRIMSALRIRCICNPEVGYERYNSDYYPLKKP